MLTRTVVDQPCQDIQLNLSYLDGAPKTLQAPSCTLKVTIILSAMSEVKDPIVFIEYSTQKIQLVSYFDYKLRVGEDPCSLRTSFDSFRTPPRLWNGPSMI